MKLTIALLFAAIALSACTGQLALQGAAQQAPEILALPTGIAVQTIILETQQIQQLKAMLDGLPPLPPATPIPAAKTSR